MDEIEIEQAVMVILQEHDTLSPISLVDKMTVHDVFEQDVRRAWWRLIDRGQVYLTEDLKLKVLYGKSA